MSDPVVIDGPNAKEAMRDAQSRPVRVDVPGVGQGYIVSDETMRLIRRHLMRELADNLAESAQQAEAHGFLADELKRLFPDYAGD